MGKLRVEAGPSVHNPEPAAEPDLAELAEVSEPEPEPEPEPEEHEPPEPELPLKSDSKAVWVDYAVALGEVRADVETWTKAEIVEAYGP